MPCVPSLGVQWSSLAGEFAVHDSVAAKYRPVTRNAPHKLRVCVLIYLKFLSGFKNIKCVEKLSGRIKS